MGMIIPLATTRFAILKRRLVVNPSARTTRQSMAPNNRASSSSSPDLVGSDDVVISRIYLIRHGDRFDYADPSWAIRADGLSESHATDRRHLPSADERFAYFPRVDPTYDPLLVVRPTPGHACRRTGLPCESFAGEYCRRMARLATALESTYRGRTVVLFSHAASVALVAALTGRSMRDMKFAPCGIYQMERVDDGPWTLVRGGGCNSGHVRENSPTTCPWGFSEKDFGGDDGIDLDYFVDRRRAGEIQDVNNNN
ncbi:hypothetical protein ACHAW5_002868 [Stephanodiscus triporus]|uniref:Phosphoglycerate mutase-like protein n=1 Tax=Stephanodiscus triporus TaxID=2934178 RepID=A0ABD3P990_9STRA